MTEPERKAQRVAVHRSFRELAEAKLERRGTLDKRPSEAIVDIVRIAGMGWTAEAVREHERARWDRIARELGV